MTQKFKIGDKIQLKKKLLLKVLPEIPYWYTKDFLTIVNIDDEKDLHGNQIVIIDKLLIDQFGVHNHYKLSTTYVKSADRRASCRERV